MVDRANPLLWDIGWLVLFGPPFLIAARALRHRADGGGTGSNSGSGKRPGVNASAAIALQHSSVMKARIASNGAMASLAL